MTSTKFAAYTQTYNTLRSSISSILQMAKIQTHSTSLQSSMRYLKTQLRENQQEAEIAIVKERQKSENEMARVREALLKVLRHERNLMREQVRQMSSQVRALLKEDDEKNDEGKYNRTQPEMEKVSSSRNS